MQKDLDGVDVDFAGRVANLPLPIKVPLAPVLEALANSIDAVRDRFGDPSEGVIELIVERASAPVVERQTGEPKPDIGITGFIVRDNGVGFNDENLRAFRRSDTRHKSGRGGRGVGRLMWLRAFGSVHVDSHYTSGTEGRRRQFGFGVPGGVTDLLDGPAAGDRTTSVTLRLPRQEFRGGRLSPRAVVTQVLGHFLQLCSAGTLPRLTIRDELGEGDVELAVEFARQRLGASTEAAFQIRGTDLKVSVDRLRAGVATAHEVHLYAVGRVVTTLRLAKADKQFSAALKQGEEPFFISALVGGAVLEGAASQERDRFNLLDEPDGQPGPLDPPALSEIYGRATEAVRQTAAVELQAVSEAVQLKVEAFVEQSAPQYRPILKHLGDVSNQLAAHATPTDIDDVLHRREREMERSARRILATQGGPAAATAGVVDEAVQKLIDLNQSSLAKYVASRHQVLNELERRLRVGTDGRYLDEADIHRLIVPMRACSDDMVEHSLWIIDDRLAFHHYLASDLPNVEIPVTDASDGRRMDVASFHRPRVDEGSIAFADGDAPAYSGIIIVEFKKPNRTDYEVLTQVLDYIENIRNGKLKDRRGRPVPGNPRPPIYAYIVCDVSPALKQRLTTRSGMRETPDGLGLVGFWDVLGAAIEVLTFDKLVADAKKRNQAFFHKLGLPPLK